MHTLATVLVGTLMRVGRAQKIGLRMQTEQEKYDVILVHEHTCNSLANAPLDTVA